ncbi:MAG TPA: hypothetical protein VGG07_00150 [Solirubrobacteraceae bacterium]|jgi:hypothetical protein
MKRFSFALAAGLSAFCVIAGVASAQIVELGQTSSTPVAAPACPPNVSLANCLIVLTRTTAVQTETNGVINPTKVTKDGWIVAFTVGLSKLTSDAKTELGLLKGLDAKFGGPPQLVLSVLKPGPKNSYTVVAQSATFHVLPFLGSVLQEPLSLPPTFTTMTALPVKKGEVVGLTVLTWAPVLTYNLTSNKYSYRQSRRANCIHAAASQTAQTTLKSTQQYLCDYTGTRVQYSATEVVNQPYPKTYVGGPTPTKK